MWNAWRHYDSGVYTHLELNAAANLFCIPIMVVTDSIVQEMPVAFGSIYPKEARTINVLILILGF